MVDWSSSAILVEGDVVWTGLVQHTEGRGAVGGLLRWDARTGATRTYAIPDVILALRRVGPRLYAGAGDGIYVLDGERLLRARFRRERGGGLSVAVESIAARRR